MKKSYVPKVRLNIPSNNVFLETALGFIENCAEVFNFEDQEIFQIRLASEEAVSNIIKHAFSNDITESFEIICLLEKTEFKIILYEKGKPFEIEKIIKYDPKSVDVECDAKGLGSFLIQKYMDVVEYKNMGREGKETILIKYPKSQRFDSTLCAVNQKREKIENFTFSIREFKDEDAIGISECAYSAYGYTYEPYIYYPSKIVQMNQTKKMHSFIAQCDLNNEIISHVGLKYDNNPFVAEVGVAFVKKEYRGNHVFNDVLDYVLDQSKSIIDLKCIFGRAVTSHTISQNVLLDRGFIATAITLALFPSDVDFKDISGAVVQKDAALFVSINTNHDTNIRDVYLPKKHQNIIVDIFKSLDYNISVKEIKNYDDTGSKSTKIDYKIIDIFNCAEIYCSSYTKDSVTKIHSVLKTLCVSRVDAIYLYLDLEDELLDVVVKECEELGFFFAGVLPFGIDTHHAIMLQYLNNLDFDFDAMKITNPHAKFLQDYILECYNEREVM